VGGLRLAFAYGARQPKMVDNGGGMTMQAQGLVAPEGLLLPKVLLCQNLPDRLRRAFALK
jgi:hypothetical protein